MASSFAAQLTQIAAKSSNELDLKAQKASHSESLIFDRRAAGSQDIESIYQICLEGYQELCQLDSRFADFESSLFSTQSKNQDRSRMTAQENESLDTVLELFLGLVGSRILLRPAIKAVEWLIRRFKVHTHNTTFILCTFLPYHETPIFRNLLSILPAPLPHEYKFLNPYLKTATNPPRHAIAYGATNSDGLFATLNAYTIQVCKAGSAHSTLLSFWGSIAVEAVAGRLMVAQSGRREVQQQRHEDLLIKVLPLLSDGFSLPEISDLVLACYTITMVLASKCDLADNVIDSLMDEVAATLRSADDFSGLTCLSILCSRRSKTMATKAVLSSMMKIIKIEDALGRLSRTFSVDPFIQGLVSRALHGLKQKNCAPRIGFLEKLLRMSTALPDQNLTANVLGILVTKIRDLSGQEETIRGYLTSMIQKLCESDAASTAITKAISVSEVNLDEVESLLGGTITQQIEQPASSESDSAMDLDVPGASKGLHGALSHLPERTVDQHSFLVSSQTRLFKQLEEAFKTCCGLHGGLVQFESLPIWSSTETESPLYISFLLRITAGNQTSLCRTSALRLITRSLSIRKVRLDAQALLPYVTVCLADQFRHVRRAASEVLVAMVDIAPSEDEPCVRWGAQGLYGPGLILTEDQWIPSKQLAEIIRGGFLPVIEECIFDSTQIGRAIRHVLTGSSNPQPPNSRSESVHLKKAVRRNLFDLLTNHLLATPSLRVKMELIRLLDGVERVGSASKTKTLSPLLVHWMGLNSSEASEAAAEAGLSLPEVDRALTFAISTDGKEALSQLLQVATDTETETRSGFVDELFERVIAIWKDLEPESRSSAATQLLDISMSPVAPLKRGARNVLRSTDLPTSALLAMLSRSRQDTAKMQENPPAPKRRRTSHGQAVPVTSADTSESDVTIALLTFILELVDGAEPENHPELLSELFQILSMLKFLRQHKQGQFPYLLRLCLGSILAIVKRLERSPQPSLDLSAVRTDLVIDCIRSVENPQVQNTALLLIAALAVVDPEHVLHSVMPIFTFMGNSVLSKDDDHSVHVTNQTIDQVVPPMVSAVRDKDKDNLIRPMSDLISSFAAAFDHIPQHRRLSLFERLLSRLGVDDYAYATIGTLAIRKLDFPDLAKFFTDLMEKFGAATTLFTCRKLLAVAGDIFSTKPNEAEVIAGIDSSSSAVAKRIVATTIISTAGHLIHSKALKIRVKNVGKLNAEAAVRVRHELRRGFSQILELMHDSRVHSELSIQLNQYLQAFLSLPPLVEYLESLPQLLQEVDQFLRVDILTALGSRLNGPLSKDTTTQQAAISFLQVLTSFLTNSDDVAFKVAAIACIDRISELYGRKDITAVLNVATILAQERCLGSESRQLSAAALLCLASLIDILKEAVIPIVPELMPRVFKVLEDSVDEDESDAEVHNACFSLLSAMISHVPFMISEEDLDRMLTLSADSANTGFAPFCHQNRRDFLVLLSRKIEIKQLVSSLARTWKNAVENDMAAIRDALQVLGNSIQYSGKSAVVKAADPISAFSLQAMDFRHIQFMIRSEDSYSDDEVDEIEAGLHEALVKFIYKLNDNVFRPVFAQWVDWAVECPGLPKTGLPRAKMLRQTSLFNFLTHFFTTLQSIVTSYASYILDPVVEVVRQTASSTDVDDDEVTQYLSALSMLTAAASNDQDAFFASPSHFSPLDECLISQLNLAANASFFPAISTHIIPAIIALATAVVDTPAHHVTMNKLICQLRHSEHASVRMASIKCQAALTASEDVGEEWVGNIVSGGGETMVYVNEMLEDDDEAIDKEVRRWVRRVREIVGEDVFEN